MRPFRPLLAPVALVFLLPLSASIAAPNLEGGGEGSRAKGGQAQQGPRGQQGDRRGGRHKPILVEVITFLRAQGITDIDSLSEDRRAELSQAFRDAKGKEHMTARIRALVDALIAEGITTPPQIEALTEEQRRQIMEAVRETMEADRPPMMAGGPDGGGQPSGPDGGPRGGQGQGRGPQGPGGPGEGPGNGGDRLLEHFANMLTEAGITDISGLSDSQIAALVPKPGNRNQGRGPGQGEMKGQGQGQRNPNGNGQGPQGNRQGKGPGQGRGPGGPGGGPGDNGGPQMDPVAQVLDFLLTQGIDSIAGLTDQQIDELQLTFRETMRPQGGPARGRSEENRPPKNRQQ